MGTDNSQSTLLDAASRTGSLRRECIGVGLCFRDEQFAIIAAARRVPTDAWTCQNASNELTSTVQAAYTAAVDGLIHYVEKTDRQRQLMLGKRGQLLLRECIGEQADFVVLSKDVHEITRFVKYAQRDLGETFLLTYVIDPFIASY